MSGIISGLFERRFHVSQTPPGWISKMGGRETASGITLNEESSLQISAVFACVRVLAETVASLPLHLYRRLEPRGKERAVDHPLYAILHDLPNPEMTSYELREALMGHLVLRGNAYAEIQINNAGQVIGLWPLRPDRMRVARVNEQLTYFYRVEAAGAEIPLTPDRVLHLRTFGHNGIVGLSPIQLAKQALGLAMATEEFGARYFGNGAQPGGVLEHPAKITEEAHKRMAASWDAAHKGLESSHRIAILEEGVKYQQVGIPPEDSQFLQTRKFQVNEIARIFRVPPHMIGDLERATFSNIEHQSLEFVMYDLMPWLVRWEQALGKALLSDTERKTFYAKHLVDGLLRGDTLSRYQAYGYGRQWGFFSSNDIRELEDMNPVDGGDEYLVPLNMTPLSEITQLDASSDGQTSRKIDQRSLILYEERAAKSARERHRLVNSYKKLYRDVAARILRRENNDIRNGAQKHFQKRDYGSFLVWLEEWLREHEEYIIRQVSPLASAYAELIADAAAAEVDAVDFQISVERFTKSYIGGYAARHTGISNHRLRNVLEGATQEGTDLLEAISAELDAWEETRVNEIAEEESVRFNNALAIVVYGLAGVTKIRSVAFGKNCPYCSSLDGKVIGIEQNFLSAGESLQPEGADKPLTTTTDIKHPPYHGGCDCMAVSER